jgi:hypothetical protein
MTQISAFGAIDWPGDKGQRLAVVGYAPTPDEVDA